MFEQFYANVDVVEIGHFAFILALCVSIAQCVVPLAGLALKQTRWLQISDASAPIVFALILGAFLTLMSAHIVSDFSVANVYENSHSTKPLLYKISGLWGNHEGSMVLWVLILAGFGAAVSIFGAKLPLDLRAAVLAIQASICATFILFIIATSNPFLRLANPPAEGQGLNPVLQDPALAIHPPLLYTGYVGFSIAFSFAIAALLVGRVDSAWARWVRPWTLAAWIFLTIGIAIGSWWAYYELGWGGWWFWDPVENASLMPWLTGTALLHSAIVMEKRDSLKSWTILLAIVTFSLSLLGTFLVRSGVLTSVHSFASDPTRGVFILAIVTTFTAGGLALFAFRVGKFSGGSAFSLISREGSLVLNNLLLTATCGVVLVGTLYPLALEALTGDKISVGAPFFNETAVWLFVPLLIGIPFGIFLTWKRGRLKEAASRLIPPAIVALICGCIAVFIGDASFKIILGLTLGSWVIAASVWEILWRARITEFHLGKFWERFRSLKRSQLGATFGHIGIGVTVVGIAAASAWNVEKLVVLKVGEHLDIAGYEVTFKDVTPRTGPNYEELAGDFDLRKNGSLLTRVTASKRKYDAPPTSTTEAGISPRALGDLYVVLGNEVKPGFYSLRVYFHPFVRWIWIGALIMFVGGLISLFDRRLRIGLPQRLRKQSQSAEFSA